MQIKTIYCDTKLIFLKRLLAAHLQLICSSSLSEYGKKNKLKRFSDIVLYEQKIFLECLILK